jgi:hypothetical protein
VSGFADDGIMSNEIVGRHRLIAGDRVVSCRLGADCPGGREGPESGPFYAKGAQSRSSVQVQSLALFCPQGPVWESLEPNACLDEADPHGPGVGLDVGPIHQN